jgi:hypothetical protein
MSELTKTQDSVLNGLVRHILTAGGGYLVAKGMIDEGSVETVVGAIIALAGVVWSAVAKKKD